MDKLFIFSYKEKTDITWGLTKMEELRLQMTGALNHEAVFDGKSARTFN